MLKDTSEHGGPNSALKFKFTDPAGYSQSLKKATFDPIQDL